MSSNILLVKVHKFPNTISEHCLVDSSRIFDGKISEINMHRLQKFQDFQNILRYPT